MANPLYALLGSTRGQIVNLLRRGPLTVEEIATELKLTDNAVRAHLAGLQDDGLALQNGTRAGVRKPHALFELTPAAHEHFSSLYVPVLDALLETLSADTPPDQVDRLMKSVGTRLAADHRAAVQALSPEARVDYVMALLRGLGALAEVTPEGQRLAIRGSRCPLAAVVTHHPQVCSTLESLLTELLGRPVHEACEKSPHPHCRFLVN
jgi:predicted ArsR family transcriptional regulator